MSFDSEKMGRLSMGVSEAVQAIYAYEDTATDTVATIMTTGYFDDYINSLNVNDIIYIVGSDDYAMARVTSVTTNVAVEEYAIASVQAGTVVASDLNQTSMGTVTSAASGTYLRIDQTSDSTTLTRCLRLASIGTAAVTTGDLVPAYCNASLPATGIAQAGTTIASGLFWTEVGATCTVGAGGSVIASSRHIMDVATDLDGVSGRASAISYFEAWNNATGGTLNAGLYVLNNMQTGSKAIGAGLRVVSGGASATFTYGVDLSDVTLASGGADIKLVAGPVILSGAGAPSGTAPKGSLYIRTNGTTTNDRAYINTDGATTWTALTTAA